jgi:formylglycine-generating enzyme required for sulfatase activity
MSPDYLVFAQAVEKKQPKLEPIPQKGSEESPPLPPALGGGWREPLTGMEFVWIESGCFKMGTPRKVGRGVIPNEEPLHTVCVDGFWMGKYEVTNAQYRKYKPDHSSKENKGLSFNGDNQPVVYVNWDDAKEFNKWLTNRSEDGYEFRLPTEAEWEYAARAGTTTTRFWDDNSDDACSYASFSDKRGMEFLKRPSNHNCDDGYAVTAPVGSFKPNAFGLYDMLGNVWEWCEDWFGYYPSGSVTNPTGPASGKIRVVRGGSWNNALGYVRCSYRAGSSTHYRNDYRGVRCVRQPKAVSGR